MEQVKRKNLDYIDYFRAIAIIFIVTGHTLVWGRSTMLEFNTLLFAGGTYFFVFIAGFLFQYLSYKFEIRTYFKKKFLNVICPYFVTLLPVAFMYAYQNLDNWVLKQASFGMRMFAVTIGGYIINGPVWFIGMIAIMFLFSPLFLASWRNKNIHITLLLSSLILCFIIPRYHSVDMFVGFNPDTSSLWKLLFCNLLYYFKMFLHFAFIYLFGMEVCVLIEKYHDKIKRNLKSIFQISLFLYIFHFIAQLFVFDTRNNIQTISKIIEIVLILSGLMLIEDKIKNNEVLDKSLKFVAKYSFGIFFIHYYIVNYLYYHTLYTKRNSQSFLFIGKNTLACCISSIELFLVTLFGSILFLFVIKFILNKIGIKNTRVFIGV